MVVASVQGKKIVKRTCTACGGKGWVPFIDRRTIEENHETREGEGWGKRRKWKKAHYFVDGDGLCGRSGFYQGKFMRAVDDGLKCIYCQRKLAKRRAGA